MSYPENLRQNIQYLTNYSRNVVKILPNNTMDAVTVTSGTEIKFTLPPNSLINLDDFTVNANFESTPSGTTAGNWSITRLLTSDTKSLIRRMTVECGGQTVTDVNFFNIINKIFSDYQKGYESTYKNLLTNPDCLLHYTNAGTPTGIYGVSNAAGNVKFDRRPIVINQFLGFLSGNPSYIDTSITGQITITLELAPASHVLFNSIAAEYNDRANAIAPAAVATPAYQLSNLYATITKCTIDDGIYFESVSNAIRSGMPFSYKFNHYNCILGETTNKNTNLRYEVSGKSVDMAIFTFLHQDGETIAALQRSVGVNEDFANLHQYTGSAQQADHGFKGSTRTLANLGYPGVFASRYFIRDGQGIQNIQFHINGEAMAQFRYSLADAFQQSMIDFGQSNDTLGGINPAINTFENWSKNFFIATARLNHLSGDEQFISGYDTSGTPLIIQVETTAAGVANQFKPFMCVVSTRVAQWYAGRNLVIQK